MIYDPETDTIKPDNIEADNPPPKENTYVYENPYEEVHGNIGGGSSPGGSPVGNEPGGEDKSKPFAGYGGTPEQFRNEVLAGYRAPDPIAYPELNREWLALHGGSPSYHNPNDFYMGPAGEKIPYYGEGAQYMLPPSAYSTPGTPKNENLPSGYNRPPQATAYAEALRAAEKFRGRPLDRYELEFLWNKFKPYGVPEFPEPVSRGGYVNPFGTPPFTVGGGNPFNRSLGGGAVFQPQPWVNPGFRGTMLPQSYSVPAPSFSSIPYAVPNSYARLWGRVPTIRI